MEQQLIPHLFRSEFRKITSVLCKLLGLENIEAAEDIAGETFLLALETWPYKGVPENPVAWLYAVAKNKAKNHLQRGHIFATKVAGQLKSGTQVFEEAEVGFTEQNITDSQLQMLFALCHPSIAPEAQIGLALRILCGFGIDEIATALLKSKEAINKLLYRAKEKLRAGQFIIEVPQEAEMGKRLGNVLTTLYLLYSEGYYSESHDNVLREELCGEAMRLTYLLIGNGSTNLPPVNALLSLMCFQSSRFAARKGSGGEMVLYYEQDESLWDQELITKGVYFLHQASQGNALSKYHLEAGIAYWYTIKADTHEKWEAILQLFNQLLRLEYSPIAALNRTYALSKANGKQAAIIEAEKLNLAGNPFYFALLGELYTGIDNAKAMAHYRAAYSLAKTARDRQTIQNKIDALA